MLSLIGLNTPNGHGEHDHQGQSGTQPHFLQSANEVLLKSEGDIQAAVDAFDGGAVFVLAGPGIAVAGLGGENAARAIERNAHDAAVLGVASVTA